MWSESGKGYGAAGGHAQFVNLFFSSRCKTLPVALRGISLSARKA
jgi:hypothetical protein